MIDVTITSVALTLKGSPLKISSAVAYGKFKYSLENSTTEVTANFSFNWKQGRKGRNPELTISKAFAYGALTPQTRGAIAVAIKSKVKDAIGEQLKESLNEAQFSFRD